MIPELVTEINRRRLSTRVSPLRVPGRSDGFTLVEIAVVLVIVGLLVGMGAGLLGPLTKRAKRSEARDHITTAREALVGFASARGRLPCPDTSGNGRENTPCATPTLSGLPYADLGIPGRDGYARTLLYDVNPDLTTSASLRGFCGYLSAFPTMGAADPQVSDGAATYSVTAVILSAGMADVDGDGNVRDGRNVPGDRTYDTETRMEDPAYDDIVREAGYAELMRGLCRAGDPGIEVNFTAAGDASFGTGPGNCFDLTVAGTFFIGQSQNVWTGAGCAAGSALAFYDATWGGGCAGGGASILDCDQNRNGTIRFNLATDAFSDQ